MLIFYSMTPGGKFEPIELEIDFACLQEEIIGQIVAGVDTEHYAILLPNDWIYDNTLRAHRYGGKGRYERMFYRLVGHAHGEFNQLLNHS